MTKSNKGQTTIFLCIILLGVAALSGILVDGARMLAGEAQAARAVSGAARSVLAGYGSRIKEEYGMFMLDDGPEALEEDIAKYVRKNLMIDKPQAPPGFRYADIYGYRLESLKVTPLFHPDDNRVARAQILEYMKYRAPQKILEGIWEKLSMVKEAGSVSGVYGDKIDVDRIAGRMAEAQQSLKRNIYGTAGDGRRETYYVRKFNENSEREKAVDRYCTLMEEYAALLQGGGGESSGLWERLDRLEKEMDETWRDLYIKMTSAIIGPNEAAVRDIGDITAIAGEAERALQEFENSLGSSLSEEGRLTGEFRKACESDIGNLKTMILEGKRTELLRDSLVRNPGILREALGRLDEVKSLLGARRFDQLSPERIRRLLNEAAGEYINVGYEYSNPYKPSNAPDPRNGLADKVNGALSQDGGADADIGKAGIDMDTLPSRSKGGGDAGGGAGEPPEVGPQADFSGGEEETSKGAFSYIASMKNVLAGDLTALRDEIFIDEYILGSFRNSVELSEKDGRAVLEKDFRGVAKKLRNTFFRSEVEYILHGSGSQKVNRAKTEAQVLIVRFALNTLHVYSDAAKRELAYGIAAAAGWWTGGAGIPAIANLIMCGWGMAEAVGDLNELKEGKSLPFYKLNGDWRLNLGIQRDMGQKTDPKFTFDYRDYLRLFLLMVGSDKKLGRIGDLIEINMRRENPAFRLADCCTYFKVEAEISIKYIFMTRPLIPAGKKTSDGRFKYRMVFYEGY